jgi:ribonuclease P protein component
MALPKINRIKKQKDFKLIFEKAKSFKNTLLILKVAKNDLNINRFGFVVSQKVSKKATIRNKIRRRLSEAVKNQGDKIKNSTDLVLIGLPGIEKKNFHEVQEAVANLIKKANV